MNDSLPDNTPDPLDGGVFPPGPPDRELALSGDSDQPAFAEDSFEDPLEAPGDPFDEPTASLGQAWFELLLDDLPEFDSDDTDSELPGPGDFGDADFAADELGGLDDFD